MKVKAKGDRQPDQQFLNPNFFFFKYNNNIKTLRTLIYVIIISRVKALKRHSGVLVQRRQL